MRTLFLLLVISGQVYAADIVTIDDNKYAFTVMQPTVNIIIPSNDSDKFKTCVDSSQGIENEETRENFIKQCNEG